MIAPLFTRDRIRLNAFGPEDVPTLQRWYQDSEFVRLFESSPAAPRSEHQLRRWIEDEDRSRESFLFAIRTLDTDSLIGLVHLDYIQWSHGVSWLAIGIGEPAYRGYGYGYEAMTAALQFAFDEINLHRVQLTVFSYNIHAMHLYEKLGFKREGIFREAIHRDGQRHDMYLYGILRHEWEAAQQPNR